MAQRSGYAQQTQAPSAALNLSGTRWPVPSRYTQQDILGSGSYGTVCEFADGATNKLVAIKKVKDLFKNLIDCKRILREIAIQTSISHPNIVSINNLFFPEGQTAADFNMMFIVMEICDTDLKHLCRKDITLEPICINTMMYTLLIGLRYLHSTGVYHRDLKPANCLVNADCTVKICDFGLSRAIDNEPDVHDLPNTPRGSASAGESKEVVGAMVPSTAKQKRVLTNHVVTRFYRAPELILLQPTYTQAIDTWSVGCIFAELLQLLADGQPLVDRGPLFPGSTAYPWSPAAGHEGDCLYHTRGSREMMNVIFDVIGSPTPAEVDKLQREDSQKYLALFRQRKGVGLRSRLPWIDDACMDLLDRMLRFDEHTRISDDEALAHPLFTDIREPEKEVELAKYKLVLPFDQELAQAMPAAENAQKLRTLLSAEVQKKMDRNAITAQASAATVPETPGLAVGDRVEVISGDVETSLRVVLSKGLTGVVVKIDHEGDALINFDEPGAGKWVRRGQWPKLKNNGQ